MPRIRTIKPEFPQSESMGRVSRDARLLFVQLWTLCDDYGRSRANSRALASLLFPYDDDAKELIIHWLEELQREKCIYVYEVEGQHYLQVHNWDKHQRVDHPSPRQFPPPREDSRGFAKDSRGLATSRARADLGPRTKDLGPRTKDLGPLAKIREPSRKIRFPGDWKPDEQDTAYALNLGHDLDWITDQAERCRDHHHGKGNTFIDFHGVWRNWVKRAVEFSRPTGKGNGHANGPATQLGRAFAEVLNEQEAGLGTDIQTAKPLLAGR